MAKKYPADHQQEALSAIDETLIDSDRANVVMACGTGKTLVELWATERQLASVQGPHRVVVLVPTLQLLQQVYLEWKGNNRWGANMRTICVCSDSKIGRDDDEISIEDLGFPTSTNPEVVRIFLEEGAAARGSVSVVFSTYQSADVVAAATQDAAGAPQTAFHVGVFDEAHKTVGEGSKMFSLALDDKNIKIDKRIFYTATPRVVNSNRRRNANGDIVVATMDDETVYGPRAHTLGFAEAAKRGIIVPYKIIVSVINGDLTAEQIAESEVVADTAGGHRSVNGSTMAALVAMERAMAERGLKKAITFHSTVAAAEEFSQLSVGVDQLLRDIPRIAVSGRQRAAERDALMAQFSEADSAIASNAKCLTEGVDVPTVDMVSFIDPKKSKVDIVQAAGRAMRRAGPEKHHGYIFVPLHINPEHGEGVQEAVTRSNFSQVTSVLLTLAENDDELLDVVRSAATRMGEFGSGSLLSDPKLADVLQFDFDPQFKFASGSTRINREKLIQAIDARLIDDVVDNFYVRVGELKKYKEEHGHCNPPLGKDRNSLGRWAGAQREKFRIGTLSIERIALLNAIEFDWDPFETQWMEYFEKLKEFKRVNGHCNVPYTQGGLGEWLKRQKQLYKSGHLSAHKVKLLDSLGLKHPADTHTSQTPTMPASPCHTYTDPAGRAAWNALNEAETRLEARLIATGGTAEVNGMGYFIDEQQQMRCGPMTRDGVIERESSFHRLDYEGLGNDELHDLAISVTAWMDAQAERPRPA